MNNYIKEKILRLSYQNLYKHHAQNGVNQHRKKSYHFSYIVHKNNILSAQINREDLTHPRAINYFGYRQHSEFRAILRFPDSPSLLRKCELVNVRINRHGELAISHPCQHCLDFIEEFRFRNIFYTDEKGFCLL
jgi:hypothetical protein